MSTESVVDLYLMMLEAVLPCTFFFGAANLLINIFLNAFFNGKLKFGGKI